MKKVTLTIFTCLLWFGVNAQKDFTKSLDGIEWVQIHSKTDVVLKTHNSNQLLIKGGKTKEVPEKAKGLRLVGEGGSDNTNAGYNVEQKGNTLILRNLQREGKAEIFLPASQNVSVISSALNNIEITGFTGEVEATSELVGNITIKDVTGPLTVNSNVGQVEVVFTKLDQKSPTTITTTTGNLDISLPKETAATVTMNSTMGEVYTDFDLQLPEKGGLRPVSTQKIKGNLNGGGGVVQLNSATGNIFLRKK